jgi:thioredoxin 1
MTKTNAVVALVIGLIIVGGAVYALSSASDSSMAQKESDAMMADKNTMDGAMIDETTMSDATTSAMEQSDAMMKDGMAPTDTMMKKGSYVPYEPAKLAAAEGGHVVLFFRAAWCPTCKALDADIRAHLDAIPAGLTILDVNYDDSMALKKKYGVTYQHTFVQVTADGTQIKKWSGSPTLSALIHEVQ